MFKNCCCIMLMTSKKDGDNVAAVTCSSSLKRNGADGQMLQVSQNQERNMCVSECLSVSPT